MARGASSCCSPVTGWRIDALGNITLIGGPLGPDVQIQAADRRTVELACETSRKYEFGED